jgi:hypothetical protein
MQLELLLSIPVAVSGASARKANGNHLQISTARHEGDGGQKAKGGEDGERRKQHVAERRSECEQQEQQHRTSSWWPESGPKIHKRQFPVGGQVVRVGGGHLMSDDRRLSGLRARRHRGTAPSRCNRQESTSYVNRGAQRTPLLLPGFLDNKRPGTPTQDCLSASQFKSVGRAKRAIFFKHTNFIWQAKLDWRAKFNCMLINFVHEYLRASRRLLLPGFSRQQTPWHADARLPFTLRIQERWVREARNRLFAYEFQLVRITEFGARNSPDARN